MSDPFVWFGKNRLCVRRTITIYKSIVSQRSFAYTTGFLTFASMLATSLVYPIENLKSATVRASLLVLAIGGAWVLAFLVGYERSQAVLTTKVPTETISIEGKEIPAKLVRGGDRGVLFLSLESKKLNFLRWEAIKKIEAL
jgi:hypothetical protein